MLRLQVLALSLLLVSFAHAGSAPIQVNVGEYTTKDKEAYTTIEISGAFLEKSGERVAEEIQKATHPNIILDLASPGGRTKESDKIILAMDEAKAQGKKLITLVSNGHSCESACTLVYMNGDRRIAGAAGVFMFHAVQYEAMPGVADKLMTSAIIKFYQDRGLSKDWIAERYVQEVFVGVNDYFITGKDAYAQKIGLVTELWPELVFHERAPFDPQIRSR